MSLSKLFQRIIWHNNTTPAINEDNLNAMSKAIDDIDDRVILIGDDVVTVIPQIQAYLEQAESIVEAVEELSQNPPYIGANGNWYVFDTTLEAYKDSGVDASITVDIADITMIEEGATPYVTNSGTNTDPIFHLFLPRSPKGDTGNGISNISKTGTQGLVDTYTITMTDGTTYTFTVTNGQNGSGTGDMLQSDYDSDSTVKNGGGIKAWVQSLGYITGLAWSALTGKPFNTVGNGLTVSNNALTADIKTVSLSSRSPMTDMNFTEQDLLVNGVGNAIEGTRWTQLTQTLSTSADTVYTFTSPLITANSVVDVYTNIYGINPSNVSVTNGYCLVTFPPQSTAFSMACRIYIK